MKKDEVLKIVANGSKPIVRNKIADGRYFANKSNDDYVVLQKRGESWAPINSVSDAVKNEPVIILNDCKDAKIGINRTIAVNDDYMSWAIGTGFSFTAKNGRTQLSLEKFNAEQLKELVAE